MTNFLRNLAYLAALTVTFSMFVLSVGYVFQTTSIHSARISDLQGIDSAIKDQVSELAKNPPPEQLG
jgi:hypothetical protein